MYLNINHQNVLAFQEEFSKRTELTQNLYEAYWDGTLGADKAIYGAMIAEETPYHPFSGEAVNILLDHYGLAPGLIGMLQSIYSDIAGVSEAEAITTLMGLLNSITPGINTVELLHRIAIRAISHDHYGVADRMSSRVTAHMSMCSLTHELFRRNEIQSDDYCDRLQVEYLESARAAMDETDTLGDWGMSACAHSINALSSTNPVPGYQFASLICDIWQAHELALRHGNVEPAYRKHYILNNKNTRARMAKGFVALMETVIEEMTTEHYNSDVAVLALDAEL